MAAGMKKELLYPLQEAVLASLQAMRDPQLSVAKLCGGTALSRCWLNHRLSYDLDFFLPHGFRAIDMSAAIKKSGIVYDTRDIVDDPRKANQLHGYAFLEGQELKVSFVEDAYFELFPAVEEKFGRLSVRTEEIPGLYHRKLRTVAGGGADGASFEGGRQTARDLFDLLVLSSSFMPIRKFADSLPYAFPSDAFDNGLANMPWFDLIDELAEIDCDPEWAGAKDMEFLQDALYEQIGARAILDSIEHEKPVAHGQTKTIIRKNRGRGGPAR